MASTFWIAIASIAIVAILVRGTVAIIHASKSAGGGKIGSRMKELDDDIQDHEQELKELRARIEVLESIVTDQKYDLGRQIDDLAAGQSGQ